MREYIIDFELYEDGVPKFWLQNSFLVKNDEKEPEEKPAFDQFMDYAKEFWSVESRGGQVRIKNIWEVVHND